MKKLGCAKCGGVKKMKVGGSAVAKAPVNMYGIPQENMGTSSQMGFGRNGGSVKKPSPKVQAGRTVKKVGPNRYAKEQVIVNKKDGSGAAYVATNKGTVYSMLDKKNGPSSVLSIDTTGYSKGKPTYDQLYTGSNGYKKTTVKRKDVKPLLNSMKKEASSFKKAGGATKALPKAQDGRTTGKTKPIPDDVYKSDSTNYSNAANKYLNANTMKEHNVGRDSLNAIKSRYGTPNALEKRMKRTVGGYDLKKNGGAVKKPLAKAQFGRTVVKSKTTREGLTGSTSNNEIKDVYNRKGDLVKTKINRTTKYDNDVEPLKSKITLKPGKPTVTKFPSLSRTMRIKSNPETGEAVKKMGGATKSKKK